jgi:ketosteroid isomerase-like protein
MRRAADTVRRMYEAFSAERWGEHESLFAPDVLVDLSRSGIPDVGTYHGRDGLREGWRRWRGVWGAYEVAVEEVLESGDRVLALTHVRATSRGQGLDTEIRGADLHRVNDGLIVEFAIYLDREAAHRDAGF